MASGYILVSSACEWISCWVLGPLLIPIDTYWYLLYNTLPYITPAIRRAKIEGWIWTNIRNTDDLDYISCSCVFSHPGYLVCCLFWMLKSSRLVSHFIFSGWCRMLAMAWKGSLGWHPLKFPTTNPKPTATEQLRHIETLRIIAVDCVFFGGVHTTY